LRRAADLVIGGALDTFGACALPLKREPGKSQ
jgi:hypothetical protein